MQCDIRMQYFWNVYSQYNEMLCIKICPSWGHCILYPPWRCMTNITILKSVSVSAALKPTHWTESRPGTVFCASSDCSSSVPAVCLPGLVSEWGAQSLPQLSLGEWPSTDLPASTLVPTAYCPHLCHPIWKLASCDHWTLEVQLIWIEMCCKFGTSTWFRRRSMSKIL